MVVHLFISITSINISEMREKVSECGKILHGDCSALAMTDDLFSINNFALPVYLLSLNNFALSVYLIILNIMPLDWQVFTFFPDQAISNF